MNFISYMNLRRIIEETSRMRFRKWEESKESSPDEPKKEKEIVKSTKSKRSDTWIRDTLDDIKKDAEDDPELAEILKKASDPATAEQRSRDVFKLAKSLPDIPPSHEQSARIHPLFGEILRRRNRPSS
jgi:hypothetical protein